METKSETIMPDEAAQPLPNILQTIKTIVLSLQLLDEKCFETLVIDSNYFDVPCLKLVRYYSIFFIPSTQRKILAEILSSYFISI